MEPKEKAEELVNRFLNEVKDSNSRDGGTLMFDVEAKQCTLICVDEILNTIFTHKNSHDYWQEVKQEIERL